MPKHRKTGLWKVLLLIGIVLILYMIGRQIGLGEHIGVLRNWIQSLGPWGFFVFLLIYILAVVLAVPGSAISALAGILFGSLFGVILVSIGSTIGAGLCFLISRYCARRALTRRFADNQKFIKLDRMTAEYGAIIVAITRLLPLFPFNLLNYGFGLTRISFWTYVGWSWLCMLPGTILYVVGIDALTTAIRAGEIPWPLVGVLVVMGIILTLLTYEARKKLKARPSGVSQ